jgi:hypothetical protein
MIQRRKTKQISIGNIKIGGNAPISVQSMCNTDTRDIVKTLEQINELASAGCEIVRLAVLNKDAAAAIKDIVKKSQIPVVADIHFDYRLALQCIENDVKTDKIIGTVKDCVIETGKTYKITVEVSGDNVKGYIDGELYFDYNCGAEAEAKAYTVVSNDDNGDIIIKLVNVTEKASTVAVKIDNANVGPEAVINQVAGNSLDNDNIFGADPNTHVTMKEFTLNGFSNEFNYTMPAYSVTSILKLS